MARSGRQAGDRSDRRLLADVHHLAILGRTGIFLVDRQTGAKRPLVGHHSYVHALVFSPDGKTLASAGHDSIDDLPFNPEELRPLLSRALSSFDASSASP